MARTADGTQFAATSTAPVTFDGTSYGALEFTDVGELVDIGEIGAVYADVPTYNLSSRSVGHLKGSFDYGETPITVDNERTDSGQIILRDHHDGSKVDDPVYIRITHQNGDIEYYGALVYSFTSQQLAQDTVYRASISMRIDAASFVSLMSLWSGNVINGAGTILADEIIPA